MEFHSAKMQQEEEKMRKPICGFGMASPLVLVLMALIGAAAPAGAGAGGACPTGMEIEYSYQEDFETGAPGWTHSAAVGPDTWVLQNSNPSPGSGGFNFHADDWSSPSDQRLVSPAIDLPSGANQLTMQFLNDQAFEDPAGSGGCWDGGTLEVSTDAGSTWVPLDTELLTDPYDGIGDNGPPAGRNMWCGETNGIQPWLNSIVDREDPARAGVRADHPVGELGLELAGGVDDLAAGVSEGLAVVERAGRMDHAFDDEMSWSPPACPCRASSRYRRCRWAGPSP